MLLQIYNLDGGEDELPVCTLPSGEYIIGRGDLLKCLDKRASRTHALINIEDNSVTITSTHQNPCFYQSAESTTVVILTRGTPTEIKDGDKFVKFSPSVKDEQSLAIKRQAGDSLNELPKSKIAKLGTGEFENVTSNCNGNTSHTKQASNDETAQVINATTEVLSDPDVDTEVIDNNGNRDNIEHAQGDENNSVETANNVYGPKVDEDANVTNADEQIPSSSGTAVANQGEDNSSKKLRDRCWYAKKCFRKSAHHKQEFSHPGDPDYDSDPNDFRPVCYYGVHCYRKNKDHLKQYKHPRMTRKPPKRRERKKKKDTKKAKTTNSNSSEDDYDYNDPFLDDNSEDDYEEESWSEDDDEDWTGSSDEDTGSLMKEARRFMKQN
ncbi:hypothetical protein Trydic_g4038 [Trypoxylus dichotomus]